MQFQANQTAPQLSSYRFGIQAQAKTKFSMVFPSIMDQLKADTKSVVLCGIETQACIHHTTLDLLDQGFEVHIPVDCVSSRSMTDRIWGLKRLRDSGAFLTTSEGLILSFAPDAAHPKFRQLQKIVMDSAHDTGLVK